ncbi:hypothetical protein TNCV_245771 [Trichonephila clavipes]|nr:hypothetical protein TNCV_245771 [Trichonephila clavipes]
MYTTHKFHKPGHTPARPMAAFRSEFLSRTKQAPEGEALDLGPVSPYLKASLGCGSPVVKALDLGRHVMSSSPVPLKTYRVGERCTLNLSRDETSSHWCGVVVRRRGASSGVIHVT